MKSNTLFLIALLSTTMPHALGMHSKNGHRQRKESTGLPRDSSRIFSLPNQSHRSSPQSPPPTSARPLDFTTIHQHLRDLQQAYARSYSQSPIYLLDWTIRSIDTIERCWYQPGLQQHYAATRKARGTPGTLMRIMETSPTLPFYFLDITLLTTESDESLRMLWTITDALTGRVKNLVEGDLSGTFPTAKDNLAAAYAKMPSPLRTMCASKSTWEDIIQCFVHVEHPSVSSSSPSPPSSDGGEDLENRPMMFMPSITACLLSVLMSERAPGGDGRRNDYCLHQWVSTLSTYASFRDSQGLSHFPPLDRLISFLAARLEGPYLTTPLLGIEKKAYSPAAEGIRLPFTMPHLRRGLLSIKTALHIDLTPEDLTTLEHHIHYVEYQRAHLATLMPKSIQVASEKSLGRPLQEGVPYRYLGTLRQILRWWVTQRWMGRDQGRDRGGVTLATILTWTSTLLSTLDRMARSISERGGREVLAIKAWIRILSSVKRICQITSLSDTPYAAIYDDTISIKFLHRDIIVPHTYLTVAIPASSRIFSMALFPLFPGRKPAMKDQIALRAYVSELYDLILYMCRPGREEDFSLIDDLIGIDEAAMAGHHQETLGRFSSFKNAWVFLDMVLKWGPGSSSASPSLSIPKRRAPSPSRSSENSWTVKRSTRRKSTSEISTPRSFTSRSGSGSISIPSPRSSSSRSSSASLYTPPMAPPLSSQPFSPIPLTESEIDRFIYYSFASPPAS